MDLAADEMGIDRIEIRRRNFIAPEAMPFKSASGSAYDSGDFANLLDRRSAPPTGRAMRRASGRARPSKLRGLGLGSYLEVTRPRQGDGRLRFEETAASP